MYEFLVIQLQNGNIDSITPRNDAAKEAKYGEGSVPLGSALNTLGAHGYAMVPGVCINLGGGYHIIFMQREKTPTPKH